MRRNRLKRSGLAPLVLLVAITVGALGGVLAAGWGPKLGLDLEGGFAVTLQPVEETSDEVLDQAIEIVRSRVDSLGVAEPEITRQGSTIDVSLPGVTDRERARQLVGQTAELRFRPVLSSIPGSIEDLLATTTTTTAADATTTTAGDGSSTTTTAGDDATTTTGDVSGQSTAGGAVPFQDGSTSTTAPATTTTAGADDSATTTTAAPAGEPTTGFELTPRDEDDPELPVTLAQLGDDDEISFTYQLGPAGATGEIVSTASARLATTQWSVDLVIQRR